jgi:hypothetical protein
MSEGNGALRERGHQLYHGHLYFPNVVRSLHGTREERDFIYDRKNSTAVGAHQATNTQPECVQISQAYQLSPKPDKNMDGEKSV